MAALFVLVTAARGADSSAPGPEAPTPALAATPIPHHPAPPPKAPQKTGFGSARTWVISGDYLLSGIGGGFALSHRTIDERSNTTIHIQPAFDYFLLDGLSLGVMAGFAYESDREVAPPVASGWFSELAGAIRLGAAIGVGAHARLWPRGSVVYRRTTHQGGIAPTHDVALHLYVPIVFFAFTHLHWGVGPYFIKDVESKVGDITLPQGHALGIAFTLGAWGGGREAGAP